MKLLDIFEKWCLLIIGISFLITGLLSLRDPKIFSFVEIAVGLFMVYAVMKSWKRI